MRRISEWIANNQAATAALAIGVLVVSLGAIAFRAGPSDTPPPSAALVRTPRAPRGGHRFRDAPQPEPGALSRGQLGNRWPFTVARVTLRCRTVKGLGGLKAQAVTFTTPDGTVYALNGWARQYHLGKEIEPIWLKDHHRFAAGLRKSIDPVLNRGLNLCP